ncbi:MAG: Rrf2 family transcriptional regulator [Planctomycetota bacterium]|nr:Rrf2 family transcriptional regulator [Planctomycetota bacterium]
MLSRTTEYALRAAIYLAKAGTENTTAQRIAEATKVPEGYMSKVLNTLARAGIVNSQRGPSGGFTLTVPPAELTMLRVVESVEPLPRIKKCPLELEEHSGELCPLHRVLAELANGVEAKLSSTTIAQLLDTPVVPLGENPACDFPVLYTKIDKPADAAPSQQTPGSNKDAT